MQSVLLNDASKARRQVNNLNSQALRPWGAYNTVTQTNRKHPLHPVNVMLALSGVKGYMA